MSGSGDRRKRREWVICLHDQSLVVLSSRAGLEAPTCSNVLLVYNIFLVYFGYSCVFICFFVFE